MVHTRGPQSRAALTAATGLNRSTIGDLVAELEKSGLVREGAPTSGRVGRPSPVVSASPHVVAIAVNPEVDAIEIAAIGLDGSVHVRERIERESIATPEEVTELIAIRIAQWRAQPLAEASIVGVGIAVPGTVRTIDGVVRYAPHLHWNEVPLGDAVAQATGVPVVVDNDATLGAYAEHLFGAARDVDHLVYLNGGASGIGGGLVIGGTLVRGSGGYAGEFGQNRPGIVDAADRITVDGVLEDEVNRARLAHVAGLDAGDDLALAAALVDAPGAGAEIARQRRVLATALANAVNVLDPSVVVVGGFLALLTESEPDEFTDLVREQAMAANGENLSVRTAQLREDRLLIGAAEHVFEATVFSPSADTPAA